MQGRQNANAINPTFTIIWGRGPHNYIGGILPKKYEEDAITLRYANSSENTGAAAEGHGPPVFSLPLAYLRVMPSSAQLFRGWGPPK